MDISCYRSMPKFIGAFFDTLYQYPISVLVAIAAITIFAGSWWYKTNKKPE